MSDHGGADPVGTLGEEATKLLNALQDWARDSGSEYAGAGAAAASGAAAGAQRVHEHLATGGEDCRYCPLCRVISAVRGTSPEVRAHLASAATSLMSAAAGVLATQVPDQRPEGEAPRGRAAPVQRIRLDDEPDGRSSDRSSDGSGDGSGDDHSEQGEGR
ncbi:MAG: hypothetical protein QOF53_2296 [Nocardioidaceae bacterium]|nr:hypothetical protein [Nocardioidaceae bacterium]